MAAPLSLAICPTAEPVAPAAPETVDAEEVEGQGRLDARRDDLQAGLASPRNGEVLPSEHPEDEIAHGMVRRVGGDHLPDARASDDLADADGGEIAGGVVHPGADGGVDGEVPHADQRLTLRWLGHRPIAHANGGAVDHAGGSSGEKEPAVHVGHRANLRPTPTERLGGPAP